MRLRLADLIVKKLAEDGLVARVDPSRLWPAQGFWRLSTIDCYAWEGQIEIFRPPPGFPGSGEGDWKTVQIGSYERMGDFLRRDGFSWEREDYHLAFYANKPTEVRQRWQALGR